MSPFRAGRRLTKSFRHGGPKNMKGVSRDFWAMRRLHRFYRHWW